MKLEDQICSLELSKRLKEFGIKQESLFWWKCWIPKKGSSYIHDGWKISIYKGSNIESDEHNIISAFTVAELLDLLPSIINTKKNEPFNNYRFRMEKFIALTDLKSMKFEINYLMNYFCDTAKAHEILGGPLVSAIYDTNPANACAKMLIFLKENELV